MRITLAAALALVAFAANSVLCRIALLQGLIDPVTFTAVRMTSGAVMLLLLGLLTQRSDLFKAGSWTSAAILTLYAVPFSLAYTRLSVGTGALVLFASVQVTMLLAAIASGERPHAIQWAGLTLAIAGLAYLVFPGLTAPPPRDAAMMGLAGASWGIYSMRGKGANNPLGQTRGNFLRSVPFVLIVSLFALPDSHAERNGIILALVSGIVASGLGYVAWYTALGGLTATRAASIQLAVPILAAVGGVVFLAETVTARLILASVLVLGGIALTILKREPLQARPVAIAGPPHIRLRSGYPERKSRGTDGHYVLAAVLLMHGSLFAQTDTPLVGVWKLNLSKSTYDPGPPPYARVTCTIEPREDGLRVIYDMVGVRGGVIHLEWDGRLDGLDYPVQGVDYVMTNAYRRIDDRTYEVDVKVDGRRSAAARMTISPDGQSITTVQTQPAPDGTNVRTTTVYDRASGGT